MTHALHPEMRNYLLGILAKAIECHDRTLVDDVDEELRRRSLDWDALRISPHSYDTCRLAASPTSSPKSS